MAMRVKSLRMLVDLAGIEPATSSMPWKRAPSCATGPLCEKTDARKAGVFKYFLLPAWLSQTSSLRERAISSGGFRMFDR